MERMVMEKLRLWYNAYDDKVLFLVGAPRVGKSWLVETLCREKNVGCMRVSASQLLVSNIISTDIVVITDVNDKETLNKAAKIILRIRAEDYLRNLKIIIESRLVGAETDICQYINEEYVELVRVYPLNICEFAKALSNNKSHKTDRELLKMYLNVGGMPESVMSFLNTCNFNEVRSVQKGILKLLKDIFRGKSSEILESMPLQVLNLEPSFSYRRISDSAREREYGYFLNQLVNHGVVYRISRYDDKGCKLYYYDVGLAAAGLGVDDLHDGQVDDVFSVLDGELIKNFIMQEWEASESNKYEFFYWWRTSAKAKLPFILRDESGKVVILNVCTGKKAIKSIKSFETYYTINKVYGVYIDEPAPEEEISFNGQEYEKISLLDIVSIFKT